MYRLLDNRKSLIAIAIVVAFVTVVVPTCRMVGCQMEMGYMGFMHPGDTVGSVLRLRWHVEPFPTLPWGSSPRASTHSVIWPCSRRSLRQWR